MRLELVEAHLGVRSATQGGSEALSLATPGAGHPVCDHFGRLARSARCEALIGHPWHLDVELNPRAEGLGHALLVAAHERRRAGADRLGVAEPAAWTGPQRCHQLACGWKRHAPAGPRDSHCAVVEDCGQHGELRPECRQVVEQQHAAVGKAHGPETHAPLPAAEQHRPACVGARGHTRALRRWLRLRFTDKSMECDHARGLDLRQRGQQAAQRAGKGRLPRLRCANQHDVVPTGRRDFHCPFDMLLTSHLLQVDRLAARHWCTHREDLLQAWSRHWQTYSVT